MLAVIMILHLIAVIIWIGGMFFAHMILRPVVQQRLEPPLRLPLMSDVLGRFFYWVWLAVLSLWVTGLGLIFFYQGGIAGIQLYVFVMLVLGTLMTLIFIYLFFVPFPRLKQALTVQDLKIGGQQLGIIRKIVATNLVLGLIIIFVTLIGRYTMWLGG